MKNLISLCVVALISTISFSQTILVQDDLTWVSGSLVTSATSPDFSFCNSSQVNYTISTSSPGGFINVTSSGNPSLTNGFIMPASTGSFSGQTMDFTFSFSQNVSNLRIMIVDLDENHSGSANPEETITNIVPSYTSLMPTVGDLYSLPVGSGPYNVVTPENPLSPTGTNNDASGWIEWTGVTASVYSFTYNRPSSGGYGLVIGGVEFDCTDSLTCQCNSTVKVKPIGNPDASGVQSANLIINTQGEAISSLSIDIPYYQSNVNDECLKCDNPNVESFGTFITVPVIAGVTGTFVDPFGTGMGNYRRVVYNFPTPVVLSGQIYPMQLQFPPVLDLSCCHNDVDFCLNVNLRKEDCTSCEYMTCSQPAVLNNGSNEGGADNQVGSARSIKYNDFNDDLDVRISPNPSDGQVNVVINDVTFIKGEFDLYSPDGLLIRHGQISENHFSLQLESLDSGKYLLIIVSDDLKKSTKKLIKI